MAVYDTGAWRSLSLRGLLSKEGVKRVFSGDWDIVLWLTALVPLPEDVLRPYGDSQPPAIPVPGLPKPFHGFLEHQACR